MCLASCATVEGSFHENGMARAVTDLSCPSNLLKLGVLVRNEHGRSDCRGSRVEIAGCGKSAFYICNETGDWLRDPASLSFGIEPRGVDEFLAKSDIADVVTSHDREVRRCYKDRLDQIRSLDLRGKVWVAWAIDGEGKVLEANVTKTTLHDLHVENCIVLQVRGWSFPKPLGGNQVVTRRSWTFDYIFRGVDN